MKGTWLVLLLLALPGVALAQGTGTLAGQVLDEAGVPLPGATVLVTGTTLGAASDADGNYRIIGVPVGTYNVSAQFIGYETATVENVEINSGYTRELNFTLQPEDQQLEEVVVEYERPIIQRDAIGAPRVVSGEDIQNLPVRGVQAVASLQGGVVSTEGTSNLFIRGGREQEVSYYVDGVKITGASPIAVNQGAVQEQEMLIGTIPARYGDVQSGVISITTRTGRDEFFGTAEAVTSEVLDEFGYNLAALSIGGPIMPGRVGFFLSGQGTFEADASPYGIDTYRLSDEAYSSLLANPQVIRLTNEAGEVQYVNFPWEEVARRIDQGEVVNDSVLTAILGGSIPAGFSIDPNRRLVNAPETFTADRFELARGKDNPVDDLTFNGNLNFDLSRALSLRVGGGLNRRRAENFTFSNSLYNRDVGTNTESDSWRAYATFRQRLSNTAFYQVQGEFLNAEVFNYPRAFSTDVEDALFYGDIDHPANALSRQYFVFAGGRYRRVFTADAGTRPSQVTIGGFGLPGRPTTGYSHQHDQNLRFSGNATTQLGLHQIEFGGEWERLTRRFFSLAGAGLAGFYADENGPENSVLGLPEGGATSYEELPFEVFRDRAVWYGYDFRGLNEVDDQDIDAYFTADPTTGERANPNVAPYRPMYYAGYIQDKIEYRDLVINVGLRADVFDNNTPVLRDIYSPVPIIRAENLTAEQLAELPGGGLAGGIEGDFAVYFDDSGNIVGFRDLDGNFFDPSGAEATVEEITETRSGQVEQDPTQPRSAAFTDYEPQLTVMPRVGVSFPVTDRALFFASYNVTSQRPTEFAFTPFTQFEVITGQDSRVANPSLEP
ncbi:MAG TPA: carboxypeptidase-like regulatory domain-containing protein, partial [Rubricoccaceae bacterium]|nr:carboxypeptidase-like regulatory domain-containing protein [Rubricoccaceae bacterium]